MRRAIGLLDIFGFENFQNNRYDLSSPALRKWEINRLLTDQARGGPSPATGLPSDDRCRGPPGRPRVSAGGGAHVSPAPAAPQCGHAGRRPPAQRWGRLAAWGRLAGSGPLGRALRGTANCIVIHIVSSCSPVGSRADQTHFGGLEEQEWLVVGDLATYAGTPP